MKQVIILAALFAIALAYTDVVCSPHLQLIFHLIVDMIWRIKLINYVYRSTKPPSLSGCRSTKSLMLLLSSKTDSTSSSLTWTTWTTGMPRVLPLSVCILISFSLSPSLSESFHNFIHILFIILWFLSVVFWWQKYLSFSCQLTLSSHYSWSYPPCWLDQCWIPKDLLGNPFRWNPKIKGGCSLHCHCPSCRQRWLENKGCRYWYVYFVSLFFFFPPLKW